MDLPLPWQEFRVIVESIGIIAASASAVAAVFQYRRHISETQTMNTLERFKNYLEIRKNFSEDRASKIINALRDPSFKSSDVSRADKDYLLGLFEEILVLKNSNLISEDMAFYGFGAYAREIYENRTLFSEKDKKEAY
jgi:hypothetical protein